MTTTTVTTITEPRDPHGQLVSPGHAALATVHELARLAELSVTKTTWLLRRIKVRHVGCHPVSASLFVRDEALAAIEAGRPALAAATTRREARSIANLERQRAEAAAIKATKAAAACPPPSKAAPVPAPPPTTEPQPTPPPAARRPRAAPGPEVYVRRVPR